MNVAHGQPQEDGTPMEMAAIRLMFLAAAVGLLINSILLSIAAHLTDLMSFPYALQASAPFVFGGAAIALVIGGGSAIFAREAIGPAWLTLGCCLICGCLAALNQVGQSWALPSVLAQAVLAGLAFLSVVMGALTRSAWTSIAAFALSLIVATIAFTVSAPVAARLDGLMVGSLSFALLGAIISAPSAWNRRALTKSER